MRKAGLEDERYAEDSGWGVFLVHNKLRIYSFSQSHLTTLLWYNGIDPSKNTHQLFLGSLSSWLISKCSLSLWALDDLITLIKCNTIFRRHATYQIHICPIQMENQETVTVSFLICIIFYFTLLEILAILKIYFFKFKRITHIFENYICLQMSQSKSIHQSPSSSKF